MKKKNKKKKRITTAMKVRVVYKALSKASPDGGVTPQMVLNASRKKNSLLYDKFTWNNKVAGENFRLNEARILLNRITVEVDDVQTREFENLVIEVNSHKVQKYYHIKKIMATPQLKKAVIKQVLEDLAKMAERYEQYKEIYKILKGALDVMENEVGYASA